MIIAAVFSALPMLCAALPAPYSAVCTFIAEHVVVGAQQQLEKQEAAAAPDDNVGVPALPCIETVCDDVVRGGVRVLECRCRDGGT